MKPFGLVGRMVMKKVKRGDVVVDEPCEVMACQTGGDFGGWKILVATKEGVLIETGTSEMTLIADDGNGPYR